MSHPARIRGAGIGVGEQGVGVQRATEQWSAGRKEERGEEMREKQEAGRLRQKDAHAVSQMVPERPNLRNLSNQLKKRITADLASPDLGC